MGATFYSRLIGPSPTHAGSQHACQDRRQGVPPNQQPKREKGADDGALISPNRPEGRAERGGTEEIGLAAAQPETVVPPETERTGIFAGIWQSQPCRVAIYGIHRICHIHLRVHVLLLVRSWLDCLPLINRDVVFVWNDRYYSTP